MPGGALMAIEAGVLDGVSRIFGLHADPGLDVGTRRPARGPAHRRRRLPRRAAVRQGRPHLAPAPDRGPHLRARQARHRAARRALPPPRPARRRQRGVGDRALRLGGQRHPGHRPRRRHRPDARRGRLGRRRGAGPRHDRADRGALRRAAPTSPTSGASRRWSTSTAPRCCSARRSRRCSARRPTSPPARASAARTSPGTSRASPARWPGSGTRTPGGPTYDLHQGDLRVDERAISVGAQGARDRRAEVDGHRPITLPGIAVASGRCRPAARIGCRPYVPGSGTPRSRRHLASVQQDRSSSTGGRARADRLRQWQRQRQLATRRRQVAQPPTPARPPRATAPRSVSPTTWAAVVTSRFNDSAYEGMEKAIDDLDATCTEAKAAPDENDTIRAERLRTLAEGGYNPVIAVGFIYSPAAATSPRSTPRPTSRSSTATAPRSRRPADEPDRPRLRRGAGLLPRRCRRGAEDQGQARRLRRRHARRPDQEVRGGLHRRRASRSTRRSRSTSSTSPRTRTTARPASRTRPVARTPRRPCTTAAPTSSTTRPASPVWVSSTRSRPPATASGPSVSTPTSTSPSTTRRSRTSSPRCSSASTRRCSTTSRRTPTSPSTPGFVAYDLKVDGVGYSKSGGFVDDISDQIDAAADEDQERRDRGPDRPGQGQVQAADRAHDA